MKEKQGIQYWYTDKTPCPSIILFEITIALNVAMTTGAYVDLKPQ
jgi:hypothetical protein